MINKYKFINFKRTYILFWFLALLNIFFFTTNANANILSIKDVKISKSFEINFNKNDIIDEGLRTAFNNLIKSLILSEGQKDISQIEIYLIKSTIENFSIIEEKFIDGIYYLTLSVDFNRSKILTLLRDQNINLFPTNQSELFISVNINDYNTISNFEKTLAKLESVNDFYITNINNKYIFYKIFFNGVSDNFLKIMRDNNYDFYIKNDLWTLK
ncbi:MAG: hypothetical protein FJX01_03765 [Alphaproteobacteria bacterium]|nr:hypothetical protein [Alphaproteobacteria bacterium]